METKPHAKGAKLAKEKNETAILLSGIRLAFGEDSSRVISFPSRPRWTLREVRFVQSHRLGLFRRRCLRILGVVAVAAGLIGCQSSGSGRRAGSDSAPQLTVEAANAAGLSAQQASDANALYTIKCAKC